MNAHARIGSHAIDHATTVNQQRAHFGDLVSLTLSQSSNNVD
jgi:hypothetical protein